MMLPNVIIEILYRILHFLRQLLILWQHMKTILKNHFYVSLILAILLAVALFLVLDLLGIQSYAIRGLAIATPIAILILFLNFRDN